MSKTFQAVKGMNDCLPTDSPVWQYLEGCLREVVAGYGYQEIRTPIVENTQLFCRSIGEVTDIVEKEMYTFEDRNGDSLTLRPEGTACCVRAAEQHGLLFNQTQRLWYQGPMFRHERPQKGRYRQFHQIGVECFGFKGPDIDAELEILKAKQPNDEDGESKADIQSEMEALRTLRELQSRRKRGTRVNFLPDIKVFKGDNGKPGIIFDPKRLRGRMDEIAYLNAGLVLALKDERRSAGKGRLSVFLHRGGLSEYAELLCRSKTPLFTSKSKKKRGAKAGEAAVDPSASLLSDDGSTVLCSGTSEPEDGSAPISVSVALRWSSDMYTESKYMKKKA